MRRMVNAQLATILLLLVIAACTGDAGGTGSGLTDVDDTGDTGDRGGEVATDLPGDTTDDSSAEIGADAARDDADGGLNQAPVPTAGAIATFKNTEGTTQIVPNDPDVADTHAFTISTAPTSGTAIVSATGGLVTYTPDAGFDGVDSLVVTVTDSAASSATVTVEVTVTNRAPAPTADAISTPIGDAASRQIVVNDPDPADTATFELTVAPSLGAAIVSETGLLAYTPDRSSYGSDTLTVTVTDGSGATGDVTIDVTVTLYPHDGTGGSFPAEACADLEGFVSLVSLDPAPGTVLARDTVVEFKAMIWYSVAADDEIRMLIMGDVDNVSVPAPLNPAVDCGTVELVGTATTDAVDGTVRVAFVPDTRFEVEYYIGTVDPVTNIFARIDATSIAPGTVISDPFYEILAEISVDLSGDYGSIVGEAELNLFDFETRDEKFFNGYYPIGPRDRLPVRLLGRLSCGQSVTGLAVTAVPNALDRVEAHLIYPSIEPSVEVYQPFVDLGVVGADSTIVSRADGCGGPRVAVLSASAAWFEPVATNLTLDSDTEIGIVVHGEMLTAAEVNEGTLTIAPDGEDWPAVEVPVRVVRLPFDVSDETTFTYLPLNGQPRSDNAADTIDLPASFGAVETPGFPAEGDVFNTVLVNTNGMIGLRADRASNPIGCNVPQAREHPLAAWDAFDPMFQGCPVIGLGWADNGFFLSRGDLEVPFPGVYYRFGATDGVDWLEIVYWNHQMYVNSTDGYRTNSVRVLRLRENGTFSISVPIANFGGLEIVGWAHSDGSVEVPFIPSLSIEDGDVFEFDAMAALP